MVEALGEGGRGADRHAGLRPQLERWAEALAIEKLHGDDAPAVLAERIGALAQNGDLAGVSRLMQLAEMVAMLAPSDAMHH